MFLIPVNCTPSQTGFQNVAFLAVSSADGFPHALLIQSRCLKISGRQSNARRTTVRQDPKWVEICVALLQGNFSKFLGSHFFNSNVR
jgi:hypothetical protein